MIFKFCISTIKKYFFLCVNYMPLMLCMWENIKDYSCNVFTLNKINRFSSWSEEWNIYRLLHCYSDLCEEYNRTKICKICILNLCVKIIYPSSRKHVLLLLKRIYFFLSALVKNRKFYFWSCNKVYFVIFEGNILN